MSDLHQPRISQTESAKQKNLEQKAKRRAKQNAQKKQNKKQKKTEQKQNSQKKQSAQQIKLAAKKRDKGHSLFIFLQLAPSA